MPIERKPVRGVFERPKGSGVWWINFYTNGVQRREKAGRRSDAISLYQKRKAEALVDRKLPELKRGNLVTLNELMADAVEYAKTHLRTSRDYVGRQKQAADLSKLTASEVTPQMLDRWIAKHCKTHATANRYRSFFSLCYREGQRNGKVTSNPARLVRRRKEDNARLRYLSRDEFKELLVIIEQKHPGQAPAFVVSVYTGMRFGEQFSLRWSQIDFERKMIRLTETKNKTARNVPVNSVALAALEAQKALVPHKPTDPVFPLSGPSSDCRWWFLPALADAGITDYTWHNNRHTFCSWLAMAGVSIKEIQILAGHKSITMSARYAHLGPDVTALASERLTAVS
jgi:integrase